MKYLHKPIEVKAIQFDGNNKEEIAEFTNGMLLITLEEVKKNEW